MDEKEILHLYLNRDEQAVAETQRAYGGYCFAVAMNILGCIQDAEETVSDTMLQLWNSIPPQNPDNLKLFCARITRNFALSKWRRYSAKKRGGGQILVALEELGDCVSGHADPSVTMDKKELGCCISNFLSQQSERDRFVFLRRYFYMDSTTEIGKKCCLREANVLQILSRTRKRLKAHLIKEGYDL